MNPHNIVDHIAGFTSLRDLELIEFSLLNTINSMLKPVCMRLLKVDRQNRPLKETSFIKDKNTVQQDNLKIDTESLKLINIISNSDLNEITHKKGDNYLYANLILQFSQSISSYLIIEYDKKPTHAQEYLLKGIFQVYKNFNELLIDAQTDVLTGLANRKTFDETIKKVSDIVIYNNSNFPNNQRDDFEEKSNEFWLAIIDIDFFKQVNDNYGHLYGDEVLVIFSNILKQSFRETDMLFRFGGEEFVAILNNRDKEAAYQALERLRTTVEDSEFPGVGHITISIGAVKMTNDIFHVTLLEYADQALYFGKSNGRNQLNFFEDLLDQGHVQLESIDTGDIELF
ncbi:MAG: GGDEF domain-containing protein [Gammaproteobacteria bacterium]|nr:GGDEF domain-containing protein [Gammaproteobacteria bacterium]